MATEEVKEIAKSLRDLKKSHLDVLIKLENLEERLETGGLVEVKNSLAAFQSGFPGIPEPVLNCVQCGEDYQESKNAEGSCRYHTKPCKYKNYGYQLDCCEKWAKEEAVVEEMIGCTRGKHSSQHHRDFFYSRYPLYVTQQLERAKQVWMEADLMDVVTNDCKWAEVGLSKDNRLYVAGGTAQTANIFIVMYTKEDLREIKEDSIIFSEKDVIGRVVKAEAVTHHGVVRAIRVTLEAAHTKVPLVKKLLIDYDDRNNPLCGTVECTSDPGDRSSLPRYQIPDDVYEGPKLSADEDFHKNRKNDYEAETTNSMPLTMKQYGHTEVMSTRLPVDGKWDNIFSCKIKVTSSESKELIIADVKGYYQDHEGEWVECDKLSVGKDVLGKTAWFEELMFFLDQGTCTISVNMCLKFAGTPPPSELSKRAHHSFPQPLHLKVVFFGEQNQTASLCFEQGNPSLNLQTQEDRIKRSCKKPSNFLFWKCVDDASHLQRRDVIIFRNEDDGKPMYRPSIGCTTYPMNRKELSFYAYKAKTMGASELEISEWKTEDRDGFSIVPYAVVDLKHVVTYALKVVLKSLTSKVIAYFVIPEDIPNGSLTVQPKQVPMKGVLNIQWKVSQAFKYDSIEMFCHRGKKSIARASMRDHLSEGETTLEAPLIPGDYEIRYYRRGAYLKHRLYIASAVFTVVDMDL